MPCGGRENFWKSEMSAAFVPWQQKRVCEKSRQFRILSQTLFCSALPDRLFICMRFLSALRRACPISVQQQQQCQQQRVNALWRAYLISTARKERGISHEHAVSMPYIGLLPFLHSFWNTDFTAYFCVNALHRASPISTLFQRKMLRCLPFCVNALHRASPISTWLRTSIIRILAILVSMPYIGLLPFLQYPLKNLIKSMVSGTVFRG